MSQLKLSEVNYYLVINTLFYLHNLQPDAKTHDAHSIELHVNTNSCQRNAQNITTVGLRVNTSR